MTASEQKIKASLVETIEKWSNKNCEKPEFQEFGIYWGRETTSLMAEAAFAVLKATENGQSSAVNDGHLTRE